MARTALVVGGSSDIGAAVVRGLTADGFDCLSWGRDPARLAAAPSSLVLLGSGAARTAFPGNPAYVASKHGLAGFARAVFLDVRDRDVAVTLLSPGLVAAGAGLRSGAPADRLLQPDDVAAAVRWVVATPAHVCPVEVDLQPQRTP